ncbi:uncharacterized protein LOC133313976 [Gastrolobium bilobum]|uniref:uncharacterized protein LOC133313976 n=1 Tax=Gastrolobium bilobum TaxID=150636 RepID=UPI002AAFA570|nr:uncharacterized protein LOC133313976 [Gastrolobium bilobum]
MEIETSPQVVAKKLWNIVRIMFFMLRKGIAKCKVTMEFNLLLKRGKLAAGKAISNTLMLHHHYAAATCYRSHPPPGDYEFSCSNSPAFPFHHRDHRRRRRHHGHPFDRFPKPCQYDDVSTINAVQKVLEMLNNSDNKVEASPLVTLPGFGKSPIGKKLRVTDSPFPLKDEGDDDNQVDMAAEEFIKRFYKNLNLQQKMAAIESPNHNMW